MTAFVMTCCHTGSAVEEGAISTTRTDSANPRDGLQPHRCDKQFCNAPIEWSRLPRRQWKLISGKIALCGPTMRRSMATMAVYAGFPVALNGLFAANEVSPAVRTDL